MSTTIMWSLTVIKLIVSEKIATLKILLHLDNWSGGGPNTDQYILTFFMWAKTKTKKVDFSSAFEVPWHGRRDSQTRGEKNKQTNKQKNMR